MSEPALVVSALTVFPVKSFTGTPMTWMELELAGPRGDRRWMVVDELGSTLTARSHPRMLAARATPYDGGVRLAADGLPTLDVGEPSGQPELPVQLTRLDTATRAGDEADLWVSELLGQRATLVWLDDPARRGMDEKHGGTLADPLALHDSGPVHVTTTASLRRLDAWAAELHDERVARAVERGEPAPLPRAPLDMRRFRPNLVVDGDLEPFVEDGWATLAAGDVELRFADHCGRCVLTTIDPDTLVKGKEPLASLARHRRRDGEVWFGIQMVPVRGGRVSIGDRVETSDR